MEDTDKYEKDSATNALNELFKQTSRYFNLRYNMLIYNLLKNGHARISDVSSDSGLSVARLYQILDQVEKLK